MESYRLGHPLGRLGDVEVLSGVKGVLEGWKGVNEDEDGMEVWRRDGMGMLGHTREDESVAS